MPEMTLTARLETLNEQKALLEGEARARRSDLIEELRTVCGLAGLIPRELLDGIVAGRRRGPKTNGKKATKKAVKKPTAQVSVSPEVPA